MLRYNAEKLEKWVQGIFQASGFELSESAMGAKVLIAADLRGIDSHGVARLSGYLRLKESNRISTSPHRAIVHETPSTAVVDGDQGLGLVTGEFAMDIAIRKAEICGTGWVSVKNSTHFGIAAFHALHAIPKNMIGIAMTNASPLVTPTFGKERMLGTNPICVAIPGGDYPPIVVDLATSAAANGKLEIAQRTGSPIPEGWVQTAEGASTQDPFALKNGGALLPLGSNRDLGSHKGYGLSAIVDIMSAVLSGANYGPWVPPFVSFLPVLEDCPGEGLGHFFGAIRVDAFRPLPDYQKHISSWISRFKSTQPIRHEQPVIIPGEPEFHEHQNRMKLGIPLHDAVIQDLMILAQKYQLPLPETAV